MNMNETLELLEQRMGKLMKALEETKAENQSLRSEVSQLRTRLQETEEQTRTNQRSQSEQENHFREKLGGLLERLDQLESLTV